MTILHIISILSSCDIIEEYKVVDINIEPPVQSLKIKDYLEKV